MIRTFRLVLINQVGAMLSKQLRNISKLSRQVKLMRADRLW